VLQERHEILPEAASAAVKVTFVRDTGAGKDCMFVWVKALEPGIDITTPELLKTIGHFDCPKPDCADGIGKHDAISVNMAVGNARCRH
jgi:hypothetical protein